MLCEMVTCLSFSNLTPDLVGAKPHRDPVAFGICVVHETAGGSEI